MLCPNVWKFNPPKHSILVEKGNLDLRNRSKIKRKINWSTFNQFVTIILPETSNCPKELLSKIDDTDSYKVIGITLIEFINRQFIEAFITRGSFYGISRNDDDLSNDCIVFFTPCANLIISVNKEIYQSLGIEGKPSNCKQKDTYLIRIDLKKVAQSSGSKYLENVKKSLSNPLLPKFDIQFTWNPPSSEICPSSIAKYFSGRNYTVKLVKTEFKCHDIYDLNLPKINVNKTQEVYCGPHQLVEYVGLLSLHCNTKSDSYLNSYICQGITQNVRNTKILQWKGLFTIDQIQNIFKELEEYVVKQSEIPWVCLNVENFSVNPAHMGFFKSTFHISNDNSFSIFLTPNLYFVWHQVLSHNKTIK